MSKITFIRHARLVSPYNNYGSLSFSDISDLATGKVDPDVDPAMLSDVKKTLMRLKSVEGRVVILHADSRRALQTSQYIQKIVEEEIGELPEIIQTPELNEIFFDPEKFMIAEEFMRDGLACIRERVFDSLAGEKILGGELKNKKSVESVKNIFSRIQKLNEKISMLTSDGTHIICVTHGFLLRLLQIYFLLGEKNPSFVTKKNLYQMHNFEYGQGFLVEYIIDG